MKYTVTVMLWLYAFSASVFTDEDESLRSKILKLDAALFSAFNSTDIAVIKALMHPDTEFYHGLGGLTDYQQSIHGLKQLLSRSDHPHRKLIMETTEIYPFKGFGALHVGTHQFCI